MPIQPAARTHQVEEYYFSKKLKEIRVLNESGHDVINLGIGSPDMTPDPSVIQTLNDQASQSDTHGYQPYQGIPELHQAIHHYYHQWYQLDTPLGVLPLIGSKEGITHISLAYLDPEDEVLIPALGYPTYSSVTRMVGAQPVYFPLKEESWEPDWAFLDALDTSRIKLMWVNYPHMPTGADGNTGLFQKLVDFAIKNQILLCHDNPYSLILNEQPLSIFNAKGAADVAIELGSLSKTYNMAGWRVGWIYGKNELLDPVLRIKSNVDSGMFKPIQLAAARALESDQGWLQQLNKRYASRRKLVFQLLDRLQCTYQRNQSGLFVWGKVHQHDGEALSDKVLKEANVFITPGFIFGDQGKNYVRISLCAAEDRIGEALKRLS